MAFNLRKFVLFGDSITRRSQDISSGFNLSPALAADYNCKLDIITRGFAGYNTDMAIHLVESIIDAEGGKDGKIVMMTVHFGTNDASTGVHHVPLERYISNLTAVVEVILKYGIKPLIVGPSLHENVDPATTRSSDLNKQYSEAAQKVARKHKAPYIDLWTPFAEEVGWKSGDPSPSTNLSHLFIDGVHFTRRGYEIYYRELKKNIQDNYPEYDADSMDPLFVPCADLLNTSDMETLLKNWVPGA